MFDEAKLKAEIYAGIRAHPWKEEFRAFMDGFLCALNAYIQNDKEYEAVYNWLAARSVRKGEIIITPEDGGDEYTHPLI